MPIFVELTLVTFPLSSSIGTHILRGLLHNLKSDQKYKSLQVCVDVHCGSAFVFMCVNILKSKHIYGIKMLTQNIFGEVL